MNGEEELNDRATDISINERRDTNSHNAIMQKSIYNIIMFENEEDEEIEDLLESLAACIDIGIPMEKFLREDTSGTRAQFFKRAEESGTRFAIIVSPMLNTDVLRTNASRRMR